MKRLIGILMAVVMTGIILSGCTTSQPKKTDKIQVASTLNVYGEAAQAVGGNQVKVDNLLKSNADPHEFEPTTQTAKTLQQAQIVLYNGIGYDAWIERIIPNSGDIKSINVGEQLMHKKDGDNPHIWYNLETMRVLTSKLVSEFSAIKPSQKAQFKKNADQYLNSLKSIETTQNKIKQAITNKKVDVSEPVYDYTLESLGFKVNNAKFALAIENDTDPSPKMIEEIQQDIKQRRIAFFVNNSQTSNKITDGLVKLAKQHKVPVVEVTETQPASKTYEEWMLSQLKQVQKALGE